MTEPRPVFTGTNISNTNPAGFRQKGLLLQLSIHLGKVWKVLLLSSVWFLSGCLSHVLYHPSRELRATPADLKLPYESVSLETADGKRLSAWWVPSESSRGVLLFCHGNAGNISDRLGFIRFFNRLGLSIFIFDYRGYGESSGSPSEQGIYRDTEAAWNYLEKVRRIDPEKIVVFGRSLGGSIAAWISQRHRPGALILESGFASLREAAQDRLPRFLANLFVPDQYPTTRYLAMVQCPVLIIHSRDDEIIPFHHGEALFTAAREPKELVTISGSHNSAFLESLPYYEAAIVAFLSKIPEKKKEE
ncbi:MAG: alpha/beta hydrolase [Thermodesulfobacteriota bacterium]